MVKLLAVITCFLVIVLSMAFYIPLNNLFLSGSWQSLSYGPATQALLPVFILVVDIVACPLILISMVED